MLKLSVNVRFFFRRDWIVTSFYVIKMQQNVHKAPKGLSVFDCCVGPSGGGSKEQGLSIN